MLYCALCCALKVLIIDAIVMRQKTVFPLSLSLSLSIAASAFVFMVFCMYKALHKNYGRDIHERKSPL